MWLKLFEQRYTTLIQLNNYVIKYSQDTRDKNGLGGKLYAG